MRHRCVLSALPYQQLLDLLVLVVPKRLKYLGQVEKDDLALHKLKGLQPHLI